MATSPIYSWPEPDNTDLVKNGALAIRTLGNAIDTTMGTMVAKTVVDAKGDLIAGTAADTVNRLAVGNNGETLVADSSTSTGLRYQGNFAAGKNKFINGDFNIWQRGTSFNLPNNTNTYAADRMRVNSQFSSGTSSVSRQTFTPGTAPVAGYEGQYFQRITAGTTPSYIDTFQLIEDVRTFAGQTVTFSFWAKASTTATAQGYFIQNFGSGGSAEAAAGSGSFALTTSWTRFSVTYAVPSISGKTVGTSSYLAVGIYLSGGLTSSMTIDTWGWQVEASNTATAFQTATGTIQGELAACQRYLPAITTTAAQEIGSGMCLSSTQPFVFIPFQVPARVAPTGITATASNFLARQSNGASTPAFSAISFNSASPIGCAVLGTTSSLTQGNATTLQINGTILFTGCEL
jgi:hypothetical protein